MTCATRAPHRSICFYLFSTLNCITCVWPMCIYIDLFVERRSRKSRSHMDIYQQLGLNSSQLSQLFCLKCTINIGRNECNQFLLSFNSFYCFHVLTFALRISNPPSLMIFLHFRSERNNKRYYAYFYNRNFLKDKYITCNKKI